MKVSLPTPDIPTPPDIPAMDFKPPSAQIPYFPPIVIPPGNLEAPPGVKQQEKKEEPPPPPKLKIPRIDIEIPLPTTAVVMTATYAAVAAVATTTLATPFFDSIKKKVQKFLQKKIDKWKENRKKRKDSSTN